MVDIIVFGVRLSYRHVCPSHSPRTHSTHVLLNDIFTRHDIPGGTVISKVTRAYQRWHGHINGGASLGCSTPACVQYYAMIYSRSTVSKVSRSYQRWHVHIKVGAAISQLARPNQRWPPAILAATLRPNCMEPIGINVRYGQNFNALICPTSCQWAFGICSLYV